MRKQKSPFLIVLGLEAKHLFPGFPRGGRGERVDCSVPPVYGEERGGGLVNRAFLVPHQSTATWKRSREPFVLTKERDIPLILGKLCTVRRGPRRQHHHAAMADVWGGSPVMAKPPRKRLLSCPQSRSTAKPPHFLSRPHPSELRPAWRPLHRAEDLGVFHRLLTLPSFPPRVPSPAPETDLTPSGGTRLL